MTTIIVPFNWNAVCALQSWPIVLLAARNLGLIWLFVVLMAREGTASPLA
jgi:hypothetical protein